MAGIQALDPFNRPSDGLRPLRDDEAENLWSEIKLLFDTPTGSSTQPKKIRKKKVHNLSLWKKGGRKQANKSLHILRTLHKEGYNQSEIDLLFNTIILPNINYALSVYAASESDLTPVQCFLDRCFKRKYTSKPVSVYDFLERQDRKIFRKVSNAKGHPLLSIMPRVKPSSYNLRKETCFKPKINTMPLNNSFINRLVFKYELAM